MRGFSEKFPPQGEDGSTHQYNSGNVVMPFLTATHQSFSHFRRAVLYDSCCEDNKIRYRGVIKYICILSYFEEMRFIKVI